MPAHYGDAILIAAQEVGNTTSAAGRS